MLGGLSNNMSQSPSHNTRSTVTKREFTGTGFFSDFFVTDESLLLNKNIMFELGNIHATTSGLKYGVGFVLFVRNGSLNQLEGYSYGEEKWPEEITDYKLFLVKSDGSLTKL